MYGLVLFFMLIPILGVSVALLGPLGVIVGLGAYASLDTGTPLWFILALAGWALT